MQNTIKVAIESFTRHNLPIPDGLTNWCIEHSREDLLAAESDSFLPTREQFASLLGVDLPADFVVESAEKPYKTTPFCWRCLHPSLPTTPTSR